MHYVENKYIMIENYSLYVVFITECERIGLKFFPISVYRIRKTIRY